MVILKLLFIIVASFLVVGIISYCLEIARYIKFLENKLEKYQTEELNNPSQNKQGH